MFNSYSTAAQWLPSCPIDSSGTEDQKDDDTSQQMGTYLGTTATTVPEEQPNISPQAWSTWSEETPTQGDRACATSL